MCVTQKCSIFIIQICFMFITQACSIFIIHKTFYEHYLKTLYVHYSNIIQTRYLKMCHAHYSKQFYSHYSKMFHAHGSKLPVKLKRYKVNGPLLSVNMDLMCLWDLHNSDFFVVLLFCFVCSETAKDFEQIRPVYFLSNRNQEAKIILFYRISTWWIRNVVVLLVDWNLSSPFYLHSTQPVLHHLCRCLKAVNLYFVYVCLQLRLVWSVVSMI